MKFLLNIGLAMSLTFAAVSHSQAATIVGGIYDGTDVGFVDTFIGEYDKAGSPTQEQAFINSLGLSTTFSFTVKTEDVVYYGTDMSDVFAFDATPASDYFLIKNAQRMALFQNLADLDWGVFNTTSLSSAMNLPDTSSYEISHVTRFNGSGSTSSSSGTASSTSGFGVPEPSTYSLLGLAAVAFGFVHRRRQQKV